MFNATCAFVVPSAIDASCLLAGPFVESERSVHQLFDERHTVELDELNVRFHTTIEREAYLPRSRKDLGVLDSGFVLDMVRTERRVAFDHVEIIAMEIPRPVEPGVVGEPRHVDDQRIALPAPVRPSQPRLTGR